jgi:hypothetical protein
MMRMRMMTRKMRMRTRMSGGGRSPFQQRPRDGELFWTEKSKKQIHLHPSARLRNMKY